MFRFANPQYLWLLLAVPALVALYWLAALGLLLAEFLLANLVLKRIP